MPGYKLFTTSKSDYNIMYIDQVYYCFLTDLLCIIYYAWQRSGEIWPNIAFRLNMPFSAILISVLN